MISVRVRQQYPVVSEKKFFDLTVSSKPPLCVLKIPSHNQILKTPDILSFDRMIAEVCNNAITMLIGYARVSTPSQSLDLQIDALVQASCDKKKIFTDIASGSKTARPGLDKAIDYARDGDILVVWKLDRLGRSLGHLIEVVKGLNDSGIGFKSIQENLDTTTSGGRLIFHVFGANCA